MGSKAKKITRGSPRYTFTESDSKTIRFTSSKSRKIILSQLIDISETGIAFSTSFKLCPRIGEIIKMDFAPPGSFQIAVEGRVVRTEEPTQYSNWARFPGTIKVGIVFYHVPKAYKQILNDTISNLIAVRIEEARGYKSRAKSAEPSWFIENIGSILFAGALVICFIGGLYYFLNVYQPSSETQNSAWAQSFFDKVITPPKK